MKSAFSLLVCHLTFTVISTSLPAQTILTFDGSGLEPGLIDPNYGDRAISSNSVFTYGGTPATPNVIVSYGPEMSFWQQGYSDLENVIYNAELDTLDRMLQITLTADPGYQVVLHSFDLGGYVNFDNYILSSVSVSDGLSDLFFDSAVSIPGYPGERVEFAFGNLVAQQLIINVDASSLDSFADDIGIDNISFSQIPEPSTYALVLGLVACGLVVTRRFRSARA